MTHSKRFDYKLLICMVKYVSLCDVSVPTSSNELPYKGFILFMVSFSVVHQLEHAIAIRLHPQFSTDVRIYQYSAIIIPLKTEQGLHEVEKIIGNKRKPTQTILLSFVKKGQIESSDVINLKLIKHLYQINAKKLPNVSHQMQEKRLQTAPKINLLISLISLV